MVLLHKLSYHLMSIDNLQIRRMERKANTLAFKEEQKKLEKTIAYNNLNHQGVKL